MKSFRSGHSEFQGIIWLGIISIFCLAGIGCRGIDEVRKSDSAVIKMDNPIIRVMLIKSLKEITIAPRDTWIIRNLEGDVLSSLKKDAEAKFKVQDGMILLESGDEMLNAAAMAMESDLPGGIMEIKQVPYGVGWWWEGTQDRSYEGRMEIRPSEEGFLEIILILPMEEYLLGVVPSEIGSTSPREALCAQAVTARSEALLALLTGKYAGPHHDIGSDVDSQAYTGNTKRTAQSDEAIRSTRGLALFFEGKPLPAYYASSCGGHSEDIRNVWPHRAKEKGYWDVAEFDGDDKFEYDLTREEDLRAWLKADPNVFCNPNKFKVPKWASKNFRWGREITAEELTKWVGEKKDVGRVRLVRAVSRGSSGRMIEAEFIGEKGIFKVGPELAIRQIFKPPLKSAAFVVDIEGPAERPGKFVICGAGWGHGVGMCQTGAIAMANAGRNFHEILAHYYPTSKIQAVYK